MALWHRLRSLAGRLPLIWWIVFAFGVAAAAAIRWADMPQHQILKETAAFIANGESGSDSSVHSGISRSEGGGDAAADTAQAWGPLAGTTVRVWLSEEKRVETMPLELYVRGVLAGEMPADFEMEALKAQAVAARTYIVKRLRESEAFELEGIRADVDDTVATQVYVPLKRLLAVTEEDELARLNRAVMETAGEIVTYGGEPIQAAFFSTSNGYTENSEDYWSASLPYLRSVPSPWDAELSPRFKDTVEMALGEFYRRLGVSAKGRPSVRVTEWTEGKRIKTLRIGGVSMSGREARERLGLRSSQFSWKLEGDRILLTTYGNGHGVGMSQWGADGLAKEGRTAKEILEYYYTGVTVERITPDRI